ncbi:hypothetical protein [Ralstonia phage phiRSL1]|uniref:Uncharacterized protein n=1 Tax=Ralstonia phage phiRSL1 TaxID=1980924 RepID=B2ZY80_9CAUD|nr:hypothetical protein RSL1_ORF268 [Ralstonia phage phiRSL1]BAG41715.1 hypothetical protein [Ralstonia phage phiRSL1]
MNQSKHAQTVTAAMKNVLGNLQTMQEANDAIPKLREAFNQIKSQNSDIELVQLITVCARPTYYPALNGENKLVLCQEYAALMKEQGVDQPIQFFANPTIKNDPEWSLFITASDCK